jgi:hypothetical protein
MGVGSDGSAAVALMVRWRALWCARGGPAAALVREVGRRHLIGDIRLLSDEGTEYVGRGTTHKKGTPQGTGGPTRSSSIRSGAHRRTTHARRRPQGASGAGGLGKGATSGGALSLEHFGVPLFDCVFLKNFQLKCAE